MQQHLTTIIAALAALAALGTVDATPPPSKYYVSTTTLNWYQANNECRRLGLRLAVVNSAAAQSLLAQAICAENLQNKRFWIGGNNLHAPGTSDYRWFPNGKLITYFNFKSGQPDNKAAENCLQTWTNQQWNDEVCSARRNFACEDTCCEC